MASSQVTRLGWITWMALGVLLVAACGGSGGDPRTRLSLRGVEVHDDQQRAFSVTGVALPVGSAGTVTLEGTWFGALDAPRATRVELPCVVTGTGEAVVLREALSAWTLPGVFSGELSLDLSDKNTSFHGGPIATSLGIDGEYTQAGQRLQLLQRSHDARAELGVTLELEPGRGLRVLKLAAGGSAARAGVLSGDLLRRLAGAPLLLESVVVLPASGQPIELTYERAGVEHRTVLRPADTHSGSLDLRAALWIMFSFACAGAFLSSRRHAAALHPLETIPGFFGIAAGAIVFGSLVAVTSPWWLMVLGVLPELRALSRSRARRDALLALASLSCVLLVSAACVVQARTFAHSAQVLPLSGAPWLWLCVPAVVRPWRSSLAGRALNVVSVCASGLLWGDAAFGTQAMQPGMRAVALLLAVVCLSASAGFVSRRASLLGVAGCSSVALVLSLWSPAATALALPAMVLTCAALGVLCGKFGRARAEELLALRRRTTEREDSAVRGIHA